MISFSAHAADADLRRGLARRVPREWHDAGGSVIFQAALCGSADCGLDGCVWRSIGVEPWCLNRHGWRNPKAKSADAPARGKAPLEEQAERAPAAPWA